MFPSELKDFAENKEQTGLLYDEVLGMADKYNLGDYLEVGVDAEYYRYIQIFTSVAARITIASIFFFIVCISFLSSQNFLNCTTESLRAGCCLVPAKQS